LHFILKLPAESEKFSAHRIYLSIDLDDTLSSSFQRDMIFLTTNIFDTGTGEVVYNFFRLEPYFRMWKTHMCHLEYSLISSYFTVCWFRLSTLAVNVDLWHNVFKIHMINFVFWRSWVGINLINNYQELSEVGTP
jgi:hypothetical protein